MLPVDRVGVPTEDVAVVVGGDTRTPPLIVGDATVLEVPTTGGVAFSLSLTSAAPTAIEVATLVAVT